MIERGAVLRSYAPAIVFLGLGTIVGVAFAFLNSLFGPRKKMKVNNKTDPYECGLPSDVKQTFRFGISFYLVGMLFILFDIEVLFLYPIAVQLKDGGTHALIAMSVFLVPLILTLVYEWRRGALDWR